MAYRSRTCTDERGQASVELVALLPVLALIALLTWQLVVAGHAVWLASGAARAAARARAVGASGLDAARGALPPRYERGLRVTTQDDGEVRVRVRVPRVVGRAALTTITARARFEPQEG